ncbi:MAG TPA: LuxR C-terminal-related transcriptional regulator, partial [Nitrolancea sp.]|nr:LuxR C-terminal-related transcriptional regulator [Nitrolancea sp.]
AQETRELAHEYLGDTIEEPAGRVLFEQSEGNPFFAEELVQGWLEAGALQPGTTRETAGFRLTPQAALPLPPGIVAAVRERLDRLPPEIVQLLQTAAIIGRTFDLETLATTTGDELEPTEERLMRALYAGLLRTDADGRYRFSHDKVRECLYDELTATRRQRVHGFIGRVLESRPETPDARRLADLTYHFAKSGDRERGATYALRAAEQALQTFAFEEATSHFSTALDLLETSDARRGTVLFRQGEASGLAGNERDGVTAFESAQSWFEQAGDRPNAARAAHYRGRLWARQEEIRKAREAYETAVALIGDEPGPALVELQVDLATLLAVSLHEHEAGLVHARQALRIAELLEDDRLLATANRSLGNLLVRGNDRHRGIPLLERALEQALAANDLLEAAECCGCLAPAYFWQGRLNRSGEIAQQRLDYAQRSHDTYQLRHVYTWLAIVDAMQGNIAQTSQRLDQAEVLAEQLASPEPIAYVNFCRVAFAYQQGDYARAETLSLAATDAFRQIGPSALVWYFGFLPIIRATAGKTAEARASLSELEALLTLVPDETAHSAEPLACVVQTALILGDHERAASYYASLLPFAGQFHDVLINRLLAEIEIQQGNLERARAHLASAETVARHETLLSELARTLEAQARLALREGDRDVPAIRRLLQESADLFARLGNQAEEQRVREPQRGIKRTRLDGPSLPAGLSPREAQVLRLVATGMSNRQIAEALFLSEKTVINHLTSIFNKTGVDNRTAAATFAIRNGLGEPTSG